MRRLLCLPVAALFASHAVALDITLQPTAPVVSHADITTPIDIVGLKPGQTLEEVVAIMDEGGYRKGEIDKTRSGVNHNGVQVRSQEYVKSASFTKGNEYIITYYATPAQNGVLLSVRRRIEYQLSDNPPVRDVLVKKTIEKYGTPSHAPSHFLGPVGDAYVCWAYDVDNKKVDKVRDNCSTYFIEENPYNNSPDNLKQSIKNGHGLKLSIQTYPLPGDANRISSIEIKMQDTVNILNMMEDSAKQIMDAARQEYEKTKAAAPTPKL